MLTWQSTGLDTGSARNVGHLRRPGRMGAACCYSSLFCGVPCVSLNAAWSVQGVSVHAAIATAILA